MSDKFAEKINDIHKAIIGNPQLEVRVVGVVPTLDLDQLYTAIRIDDPETDKPFILEGVAPPGLDLWIGPISLHPRMCVQRKVNMWGDSCIKITYGIDTKERAVGPFYLPPTPGTFEFTGYFVKRVVYIRIQNEDSVNSAEYHIVASAVMPLATDWDKFWKKQIGAQVRALKGVV